MTDEPKRLGDELRARMERDGLASPPQDPAESAERDRKEHAAWQAKLDAESEARNNREQHPARRFQEAISSFKIELDKMAEAFVLIQPLYFDKSEIWWAWNFERTAWEMVDKTDILNLIKDSNQDAKSRDLPIYKKDQIFTALQMAARRSRPRDIPGYWVQFRDQILDTKTGRLMPAHPSIFCVNPIPWPLGATSETPNIDRLFASWVEARYVPMLYEILAYCCLPDYPIHRAFFLSGTGRNGKSKFQKLIRRLVGPENVCATNLNDLENDQFATFNLHRKLVCEMGETNYDRLMGSEKFKSLTGGDVVSFQQKFKTPFAGVNYAKFVINSNGLPTPNDDSEAYWSRVLPIEFPNKFSEGPCPVDAISEEEMQALARRVANILPELLARHTFTNEGTWEDRKRRYMSLSNPIDEFLADAFVREETGRVKYNFLFDEYKRWLTAHRRRMVSRREFKDALVQEGFDIDKHRPGPGEEPTWCVSGLRKKLPLEHHMTAIPQSATLDDGKNTTLTGGIHTPGGLVAWMTINAHEPVAFETILAAVEAGLPDREAWLDATLRSLNHTGRVLEVRAGYWMVLE